jgi:hypothetical protein
MQIGDRLDIILIFLQKFPSSILQKVDYLSLVILFLLNFLTQFQVVFFEFIDLVQKL